MPRVCIKPLSVNRAWQGRRFKTEEYKIYEYSVLSMLPKLDIPDGNLRLVIDQGLSNIRQDVDNAIKPFVDILQKKYGFNDARLFELVATKQRVQKGSEYIDFRIEAI